MKENETNIKTLLSRNVSEVIEKSHLEEVLKSGKKLRVKLGIDPTMPDLHLGHAVVLRKLKEFQDLGHKIVLIIGDFTAQIGDPTGKSATRPPLTPKQVKTNMKNYLSQASAILNIKKTEIHYNSKWLKTNELIKVAAAASIQQALARADFKKRIEEGNDLTLLELLYPVFQGYDSVQVKADVEVGGTDQTFNLLMGRKIQRYFKMKEQDVLTVPLLVGTDGVKKMSKSLGNYIALNDEAGDMYGKIMSVPDELVKDYFMLCTDFSEKEIEETMKLHPRESKAKLAFAIVKIYHGDAKAGLAEEKFVKLFSKKEFISAELPEWKVKNRKLSVLDVILSPQSGAQSSLKSKSEAMRLIEQGGVSVHGEVKKNPHEVVILQENQTLKIGKKDFYKIKLS